MAGLFQVIWGKEGGTFSKPEPLKGTDGKNLIIVPDKRGMTDPDTPRICTRPTAVDYDADGDLDLVVGNFKGTFYWFAGEGKGKFSPKSTRIDCEGKALKNQSYHSDPFFVDWDGDGDLDLLSGGGDGEVAWSENSAGKGKPMALKQFKELIKGTKVRERWFDEKAVVGDSSRVWADDLNGDGKLDLIVGDRMTINSLVEGSTKQETKVKLEVWKKEISDLYKNMGKAEGEKERDELNKKTQALFDKRDKIIKEDMTGFVWVYYQK